MSDSGQILVLDLDETLVRASELPLDRPADFRVGDLYVYKRPFLDEFIQGVLAMFKVAVWSAGGKLYVEQIVQYIFPEGALEFAWASDRCTLVVDHEGWGYKTQKRIKKVKRKGYPLTSIIVVEDTPENFSSYSSCIRVTPFEGDQADDELPLLLEYLRLLQGVPNVRAVEKRNWREQVRAASAVLEVDVTKEESRRE